MEELKTTNERYCKLNAVQVKELTTEKPTDIRLKLLDNGQMMSTKNSPKWLSE